MSAATAAARNPMPDVALVRDMLGMLFDGLTVKAGGKVDVSPQSNTYVGIYIADDGSPSALCACDLALAANSGSALSMLSPNVAKDAIKSKELTEVMLANLNEVMNICTRLMLQESTPHLRLQTVCKANALPAPAAAIIGAARARADFEIGLGKYGAGVLAVMSM